MLGIGLCELPQRYPAYLTYMQSPSCRLLDWMKHKLESRLLEEISIMSDADNTTLKAESEEELRASG